MISHLLPREGIILQVMEQLVIVTVKLNAPRWDVMISYCYVMVWWWRWWWYQCWWWRWSWDNHDHDVSDDDDGGSTIYVSFSKLSYLKWYQSFQGRFSIDLTNTGISLASEVTWRSYGYYLSRIITIKPVRWRWIGNKFWGSFCMIMPCFYILKLCSLFIVGSTDSHWYVRWLLRSV